MKRTRVQGVHLSIGCRSRPLPRRRGSGTCVVPDGLSGQVERQRPGSPGVAAYQV
jgi:hypothetical protein